MIITRHSNAKASVPPLHQGMVSMGLLSDPASFASVGLSHYLPGGEAEMSAGAAAKIYVVLEGRITVTAGDGTMTELGPLDTCYIYSNEARQVRNLGQSVAKVLVMIAR